MKINEVIIERLDARDDLRLAKMQDAERAKVAGKLPGDDKVTTLIGPNSPVWDAAANARAEKLEKRKLSPIAIWQATGNWRGPEGEWRQEVSDHALKIKKDFSGKGKLKDFIDHPELEKAYPGIMDLKIVFVDDNKGGGWAGAWDSSKKTIYIAKGDKKNKWKATTDQMLGTLGHEWQHIIQTDYEPQFVDGGSWEDLKMKDISKNVTKYNKSVDNSKKIINIGSLLDPDDVEFDAYDAYDSQGGERTADVTKARMKFTPIERIMTYPGQHIYNLPVTIPGDKIPDNAHGNKIPRKDNTDITTTSVTTQHGKNKNYWWEPNSKTSTTFINRDGKYDWE